MSSTGKAVLESGGSVMAAVAFSDDRTDESIAWLRYVTVRSDQQGEGIGPKLCLFTTQTLLNRGYDRVNIAVNNPIAYQALYRAGFGFTGEETGIAEAVLTYPSARSTRQYQDGFAVFEDRDLDSSNRRVLERHRDGTPPAIVDPPD